MIASSTPVIAIDGPSASGKGTLAKKVAEHFGFHYLDSGALYRVVAYASKASGIAWTQEEEIARLIPTLDIEFKGNDILLGQLSIDSLIRTEEMGKGASQVAQYPKVRTALFDLQQQFRKSPGLVADGRDMGTVVFPDAKVKIFLTASAETRAKRRYEQLLQAGIKSDYDVILHDLQARDKQDLERATAPLKMADNALCIDTSHLDIASVFDQIVTVSQQAL
jgi:CMP/dCMP kinase